MLRRKSLTALLLLASIALATGCTRNNPTAPSDQPPPLYEHQGADN